MAKKVCVGELRKFVVGHKTASSSIIAGNPNPLSF
jgi:hypothetical protein